MKGAWRLRQLMRKAGRFGFRIRIVWPHCRRALGNAVRWLVRSREDTNLTYDLTERNISHLAAFVANVMGGSPAEAAAHIRELREDRELADHVRRLTEEADMTDSADPVVRYGRRLGWYAIVRRRKPRVVVETGVDKGLGSCVISAALRRNAAEGRPGRLYALDIDPKAGWLLRPPYSEHGTLLVGDALDSLKNLKETVDLFISDSDHSAEYEAREYRAVEALLAEDALVISDNAHCTDALVEFARETGRRFLYFQEVPTDHWYPGAGIGIAFLKGGEG